jgi:hypothetical protein
MVARINIGRSLKRSFYYNENKVKEGVASCLMAANYPIALHHSSKLLRLKVLEKQASLNERIKANSIHISLNFDPSERLSDERMKEIAALYMEKIGFGNQPYLVYRHMDAAHPHIHILSIKTDRDGKGIPTHNIARELSEPARKELERRFGLVCAEQQSGKIRSIDKQFPAKVTYGKRESKKAIAVVLNSVLEQYKFGSLSELNAILNQYNVHADTGGEGSRTQQHKGLLYHITDDVGNKVGVPIKASLFYNKPTLKYLEDKFMANRAARDKHKNAVKNTIDRIFMQQKDLSLKQLLSALEQKGVHAVLRLSKEGNLYGITYVDHTSQCVFNGSDLGKAYSAKGVLERCGNSSPQTDTITNIHAPAIIDSTASSDLSRMQDPVNMWESLLQSDELANYVPYEWKRKRKRRKKLNR